MEAKTTKELFEDLKGSLREFFSMGAKFLDFKLADGTIVRCDTEVLQKGSKMSVIDEKGAELPLPDGEYANPDNGQKFTVEGGFVKDMVAAAADPNAAPPANIPADGGGDMAKVMDAIAQITARLDAIEKAIAADTATDAGDTAQMKNDVGATIVRMEAVEKENKALKETFTKMFELVEKIANETPEPKSKVEFTRTTKGFDTKSVEEFRKNFLIQNS